MNRRKLVASALAGAWIILAAGCGGSGSGGDEPASPPPESTTHTVGGSVHGLLGTLVLDVNGGHAVTLTTDGTFIFPTTFSTGSTFTIVARTQPATQICTVVGYEGTITNADINVIVNCSIVTRFVQGTVSGLAPSESVVLQNNGGDDLVVSGNGNFAFETPVPKSGTYNVAVLTQPPSQTCTVVNGSGTVTPPTEIDVQVICSTDAYTVGGTVSGLGGTVVLQNNGADDLVLSADGPFTFAAPVAQNASYDVAVLTQPAGQTCVVTNGSGTMGGANVTNIGLSCSLNSTTLSTSISTLALSVTGLTEYGVSGTPSSGLARQITITNTGTDPALNVQVLSPSLPAGTSITGITCGGTLAASSTCAITITPGAVATSNGTDPCSNGTAPLPDVIQVSADNANTVSSDVVVLNYGCIYQGGYVFAFDDTVANTQSVVGKVAATTDQASPGAGVVWSSNGASGNSGDVAYDYIYGTSDTSTTSSPDPSTGQVMGQVACNGTVDGACNTNNIYIYYQNHAAGAPVNLTYYAAGLCKQTISGYSDWYLPAVCETGHTGSLGFDCNVSGVPILQNIQSNLVEFNSLNLLSGQYHSSTSWSADSLPSVWQHNFALPNGNAFPGNKIAMGVRCSRAF